MTALETTEEYRLLKSSKEHLYRELKSVSLNKERDAEFFTKSEEYDKFIAFYKVRMPQLRRNMAILLGTELNG